MSTGVPSDASVTGAADSPATGVAGGVAAGAAAAGGSVTGGTGVPESTIATPAKGSFAAAPAPPASPVAVGGTRVYEFDWTGTVCCFCCCPNVGAFEEVGATGVGAAAAGRVSIRPATGATGFLVVAERGGTASRGKVIFASASGFKGMGCGCLAESLSAVTVGVTYMTLNATSATDTNHHATALWRRRRRLKLSVSNVAEARSRLPPNTSLMHGTPRPFDYPTPSQRGLQASTWVIFRDDPVTTGCRSSLAETLGVRDGAVCFQTEDKCADFVTSCHESRPPALGV